MKQYSFLGDDEPYPKQNKVNWKVILGCAGFMLMIWIPMGYFYFHWR